MFETDSEVCSYNPHIDVLYNNLYNAVHSLDNSQPFNFFDISTASEDHFADMQVTNRCFSVFLSIDNLQQNNVQSGQDIRNCISYEPNCLAEASVTAREQYGLNTLMIDQYLHDIKESIIERVQHILEVLNIDNVSIIFLTNNEEEDGNTRFHRDATFLELYEYRNMCIANALNTNEFSFIFNLKGLEETTLFYKPYAIFDELTTDLKCTPEPPDDITIPHTLFKANINQGAVFLRGNNGIGAIHSAPVSTLDFQRFTVIIAPYSYKQKQLQELLDDDKLS